MSLPIYYAGTEVKITVPLVDAAGNALAVSALQYRITDETEAELAPLAALADFNANDADAVITVPGSLNALATGVARGLRNLELVALLTDGNTVRLAAGYVVEGADALVVGVNSFQTYAQAEFIALDIPNKTGWDAADKTARIAALIEARHRVCQLNFAPLNSNINWGQDSLNFVPEGTFATNYVDANGMFMFNGNLELLTPDQYRQLPQRFLDMLYRAQVAEADEILGGDPVEARRREGLIQEVVGESRQTFRAGKPLQLPVARRTLSYLSYFVTFSKRVTRAS